ncbi:rho guanine nucleotide exchange factor 37 isoform 3-T3 [Megaptera novaeangliae]
MTDHGADELSSRTGSPDGEGRVPEERSLLHQSLAVRELIDTEVSYLHVLQLCASDIRSHLQQLPQGDLDVLFSNIDDIIKVNSKLLHDLQETAAREEEQVQLIGNLFLEFQEELEQVYKVYCASYEQALLLVETYRKEPQLQGEIQDTIEAVLLQVHQGGAAEPLGATGPHQYAHPFQEDHPAEPAAEAGGRARTQEDKEFDDLEESFHWVSLCVTELKNNVAAYLGNLEAFLRFRPQEYDLDIPGGPVVQYCYLARDLQLQAFPEFKQRLEALVWQPLCSLAKALAGPQNLIKKRLDKLLDFERVQEKLLEVGSMTYEEEAARHMYEALNSLLVAELPQFKQLAVRWLGQILCTFVTLQTDLAKQVLQRAEGSLAQLPHHHVSDPAFRKLVEDALGQTGHQLHSFQQNFEKVLPPPTTQPLLPGAERQVQALLSRYGPGKLYQVTSNISGSGTLDLTLPRGHIVALLQDKDTKGNSSRWLVDTGGHRGYVPAGKLELYHVVSREEELRGQAKPHSDSQRQTPEPTLAPVPSVPAVTQVVAVYPFVARSSHEVSLQAGQQVTVLEAQDKKGNPEWSLVEVNGQRGYVPSSFLARAPGPAVWGWSLPS